MKIYSTDLSQYRSAITDPLHHCDNAKAIFVYGFISNTFCVLTMVSLFFNVQIAFECVFLSSQLLKRHFYNCRGNVALL